MTEKKVVINLSISVDARRRLEALAKDTGWPLGAVLEKAILAFQAQPAPSDTGNISELITRLAALESIDAGPRLSSAFHGIGELQALTDSCTQLLEELQDRVIRLECNPALTAHRPISGVVSEKPIVNPSPEPEPPKIAVSVAAVPGSESPAQSTDIPDSGLTLSSSSEPNPADNVLAALIAAIPEAEFVGLNGERNRKIIELHQKGLGTTQISKALVNANIANSKENSVKYFLGKHGITPNRVK